MPVPHISKEELSQRLSAADAATAPVIVDARLKYPYEHSTVKLPGALRFATGAAAASSLPRDRDIVIYDSDPEDLVSTRLASGLALEGFRAFVLHGGIADWMTAKLPTESKPAPQPLATAAVPKG